MSWTKLSLVLLLLLLPSNVAAFDWERFWKVNSYPQGYDRFGLKEKLRVKVPEYDICYEYRDADWNTGIACYVGKNKWQIIN